MINWGIFGTGMIARALAVSIRDSEGSSLKAVASNEIERKERLEQFHQIGVEKRLPIDVDVYVTADLDQDRATLVYEFSKEADMIFIGLKPLPRKLNEAESYAEYLQNLSQTFEGLPLAFVLSSDVTPLDTILE